MSCKETGSLKTLQDCHTSPGLYYFVRRKSASIVFKSLLVWSFLLTYVLFHILPHKGEKNEFHSSIGFFLFFFF